MPVRTYKAQVAVIGGGPAGFCAAVAAARGGADTLLIEQAAFGGGMATMGLVGPFMTCYDRDGEEMILRGLFEEVVDRLVARGGAIHPSQVHAGTGYTSWIKVGHEHVTPFEPEALKLVIDEMLTQAGVRVLYHTTFLEPQVENGRLRSVSVASKSGVETVCADLYIDCTGDADVAFRSGVPCEMGDPSKSFMQPASLFFRIGNVDSDAMEADIQANLHNFYRKDGVNYRSFHWRVSQARENGDWSLKRVSLGLFQGVKRDEWSVNTSRLMGVDATDNVSLTAGEMEGRRQVEEIFRMLCKYVPGCENARLLCSGSTLGIRESRHVRGEATLTLDDIENAAVPADSVFVAANSVDVHGRFGPMSNEYLTVKGGKWYGVPYGCLLPVGIGNLLVAGRSVSATVEAAGAIRVMPPCMVMGQAAGTAAALALERGVSPKELDVRLLQDTLRRHGAFLPL